MRSCILCFQPDPELHRQLAKKRWRRQPGELTQWLQRHWSLHVLEDDLRRHLAHHELPFETKRPTGRAEPRPNPRSRAILALLWRARLLTASQVQALLYTQLSGAGAQTACSRDLRWLRERKLTVRSTLPSGQSLELGERLVRRAACYSLPARTASTRGRERSSEWSWPVQQAQIEANQVFIDLRLASHRARPAGCIWDLPLGGWNAHLRLKFDDPVTRRTLRWKLDGVFAAVDLSNQSRSAIAVCYVHDAEVASAEDFLARHLPPWRSICVDQAPLSALIAAVDRPPALLVVSRSPQRSKDLLAQIKMQRFALPPDHPPLIFIDQDSLSHAFSHDLALSVQAPARRVGLSATLAKMFGRPWQAGIWQMNLDPRDTPEKYTQS